ncbi:MAG: hypothetical protein CL843_15830 [Crocinitomicaceae bacterium]|nr:hypothetical protein [Crocinitomicaceae bacterium]|tara:strand:+ start:860 stop:1657 length:798 start_codon:yes stop_codon:yes gene_type:complete
MLTILRNNTPTCTLKRSLIIGLMTTAFIAFITVFLEPFKTGESRKILVLGYSICFMVCYTIASIIERVIYQRIKTKRQSHTIAFFSLLFLSGSLAIYWYDLVIIKAIDFNLHAYVSYTLRIVVPFALIVLPLIYFGRNFSILTTPTSKTENPKSVGATTITLEGNGKNEILQIPVEDLLYVQSENNYCKVVYLKQEKVTSKLLRQKISVLINQVEPLQRCHRSYAINVENIVQKSGTKSKPTLLVKEVSEAIPVSNSYQNVLSKY